MPVKIVLLTLVLCAVIIKTKSDKTSSGTICDNCRSRSPEYTRIKRAKYYPGPPQKFYRRPPISYPTKGVFSYTPPPSYMMDDDEQHPANLRPSKVSKRPTNDGLGDDDINNIVKYLSKKDLDKIIEFAGEKERYRDESEKYSSEYRPSFKRQESNTYRAVVQEIDSDQKFALNGPYIDNQDDKSYKIEFNNPNINYIRDASESKVVYTNPPDASNNPNYNTDPNTNYVRENSQSKVLYTNPRESNNNPNYNSDQNMNYVRENSQSKVLYTNPRESYNNQNYNSVQNMNYVRENSQSKVFYTNPQESYNNQNYYSDPNINYVSENSQSKVLYTNPRELNNNPNYNSDPNTNYARDNPEQNIFTNPSEPGNHKIEYLNSNINYDASQPKAQYTKPTETQNFLSYNNVALASSPLETAETKQNYQISYLNAQIHDEINGMTSKGGNIFTDSTVMKEETLPKPVNLREEQDYEISFTNNVPTVVKAEANSYKVEGFGDLPLMNYHNSKLHTVSSYNVPHYTITSAAKHQPAPQTSSSSSSPQLELAPPGAKGQDQSDAHLKAIKIWTHRSKGTAYTLHKDGSLSLERPGPRATSYGHP